MFFFTIIISFFFLSSFLIFPIREKFGYFQPSFIHYNSMYDPFFYSKKNFSTTLPTNQFSFPFSSVFFVHIAYPQQVFFFHSTPLYFSRFHYFFSSKTCQYLVFYNANLSTSFFYSKHSFINSTFIFEIPLLINSRIFLYFFNFLFAKFFMQGVAEWSKATDCKSVQ